METLLRRYDFFGLSMIGNHYISHYVLYLVGTLPDGLGERFIHIFFVNFASGVDQFRLMKQTYWIGWPMELKFTTCTMV